MHLSTVLYLLTVVLNFPTVLTRKLTTDSFLQVVFFRGVSSNIRKEVWPFLLGIFSWKSTAQERHQTMEALTRDYKVLLAKK